MAQSKEQQSFGTLFWSEFANKTLEISKTGVVNGCFGKSLDFLFQFNRATLEGFAHHNVANRVTLGLALERLFGGFSDDCDNASRNHAGYAPGKDHLALDVLMRDLKPPALGIHGMRSANSVRDFQSVFAKGLRRSDVSPSVDEVNV